jgi:hypothetical protein
MPKVLLLFAIIYALNIIPAFAPPTWMVLSLVEFNYPMASPMLLAGVGATAATFGRLTLAKLSRVIVRQRLLSDRTRENIDAIKENLEGRRALTAGVFLFYAFSPLPSNYLFIAYGLTALELKLIALPFFIGRFVSYAFWAFTASTAAHHLILESGAASQYLSGYFIVSQVLFLGIMYGFTKLDWRALLTDKTFRWMKRAPGLS